MTDRPILFSAPMVRALLEGRKTQTRRIVKPQPVSVGRTPLISFNHGRQEFSFGPDDQDARGLRWWRCPYGQYGDRLWVRETWALHERFEDVCTVVYAASVNQSWTEAHERYPNVLAGNMQPKPFQLGWRPSIHMPRWASRLWLEITDVRVERLSTISEADAAAEGMPEPYLGDGDPPFEEQAIMVDRVRQFRNLWNRINGDGSWAANPWVWALTFTVHRGNLPRAA